VLPPPHLVLSGLQCGCGLHDKESRSLEAFDEIVGQLILCEIIVSFKRDTLMDLVGTRVENLEVVEAQPQQAQLVLIEELLSYFILGPDPMSGCIRQISEVRRKDPQADFDTFFIRLSRIFDDSWPSQDADRLREKTAILRSCTSGDDLPMCPLQMGKLGQT